jgi:dTDP-L-rhamnose 4-epimerase
VKILVTGGAGFIGSHLTDALTSAGHRVTVLDSLSPAAHSSPPPYLNRRATYHFVDINDTDATCRAVDGAEVVFHLAARVGVETGPADIYDYVRDNDLGTGSLLHALDETNFSGKLVLASSMVIYGDGAYRCQAHGSLRVGTRHLSDLQAGRFEVTCPRCQQALVPERIPETADLDPRSVYAAPKVQQERIWQIFGRATHDSVIALRYHNVYGPRMPTDTPYSGVAAVFLSSLRAGVAPQVFEDGGQLRDFVHVADVVRATTAVGLSEQAISGAYNVGTGQAHSILEMAEALASHFGGSLRPLVSGRYRPGDVPHILASCQRAIKELGYRPTVDFSTGMAELARAELRPSCNSFS